MLTLFVCLHEHFFTMIFDFWNQQNRFKLVTRHVKAIEAFNKLRSNSAVLEMTNKEGTEQAHLRLQKTFTYLQQSGMSLDGK